MAFGGGRVAFSGRAQSHPKRTRGPSGGTPSPSWGNGSPRRGSGAPSRGSGPPSWGSGPPRRGMYSASPLACDVRAGSDEAAPGGRRGQLILRPAGAIRAAPWLWTDPGRHKKSHVIQHLQQGRQQAAPHPPARTACQAPRINASRTSGYTDQVDDTELATLWTEIESERSERTVSADKTDRFGEAMCAFANDLAHTGDCEGCVSRL